MNNGYVTRDIRRGDIYWVKDGSSYGCEVANFRPMLVVGANEVNKEYGTVTCVFCTQQDKGLAWHLRVDVDTDVGYEIVKCCDFKSVDKRLIGKRIATLTDEQMEEVDEMLRQVLGLDYEYGYEEDSDEEEAYEDEYEDDNGDNLEEKIADLELELKIARAAYDRLLAKVVEMRVDADIASAKPEPKKEEPPKVEPPKIETTKVVAPVKEVAVVAKPEPKVDVNTATETALKKIGWDSDSAKAILANRPYETLDELKSLPGVTKTLFNLVSPRMECVRVVKVVLEEKVNLNTCTIDQIIEAVGCNKATAGQMIAHRTKYGNFADVKELYGVAGLSKVFVDKYIGCFTVDEVVKAAPVTEMIEGKAYVNTMTGKQIAEILGCSKAYGGYIVTYRNRNGLYTSKEELFNVPVVSRSFVEKNWEKFEL